MATVALADDSPSVRLLLKRRLEGAGHQVLEAEDGMDLIERIEQTGPSGVSVVLVDWMMPRLDGRGATSLIRERWPGIPVIGFTAGLSSDDEKPEGLDDFLAKPFDFDYLLDRIGELSSGLSRP